MSVLERGQTLCKEDVGWKYYPLSFTVPPNSVGQDLQDLQPKGIPGQTSRARIGAVPECDCLFLFPSARRWQQMYKFGVGTTVRIQPFCLEGRRANHEMKAALEEQGLLVSGHNRI